MPNRTREGEKKKGGGKSGPEPRNGSSSKQVVVEAGCVWGRANGALGNGRRSRSLGVSREWMTTAVSVGLTQRWVFSFHQGERVWAEVASVIT